MKSLLLVVLLAAAATAAVVSNEVAEAVEVPERVDGDEVADVDVNEMPEVVVAEVDELAEVLELSDEGELIDETAVDTRRSLSVGTIGSSDTRVYNAEVRASGVAGHYWTRDTRITTNGRVTAIRVTRLGTSQNATPSILSGGVGQCCVTIRIRSATGRGYHYRIQVYARR